MLNDFIKQIKTAFILFLILTLLTGLIYPTFITLIAQLLFPWQSNGSLIQRNGINIGSQWIGQSVTDPKYFWGRPSATPLFPYNAKSSSGSNLGPLNPKLIDAIQSRILLLQASFKTAEKIPVDLVTSSASGLDPEISPAAAFYQVPRIAKLRGVPENEIKNLVQQCIINRSIGFFGEPRVNVLELNLALDLRYKIPKEP